MARIPRVLSAAVLAFGLVHMTACTRAPDAPDTFGSETDTDLSTRYGCLDVFRLEHAAGTFKALVFKLPKTSASDSDYRVLFYRKQGDVFRREWRAAQPRELPAARPRRRQRASDRDGRESARR